MSNRYNELLKFLQNLSDEQIKFLLNEPEIIKYTIKEKEINIENLLKKLCVNPSLLGFNYLKEAIEMCVSDSKILSSITKTLYPTIAQNNKTSSSRVERAIRHAIETSWGKIDGDIYHEIFFNEYEKPTNSKYIAYICSYIKNQKETTDKQPTQKVLK